MANTLTHKCMSAKRNVRLNIHLLKPITGCIVLFALVLLKSHICPVHKCLVGRMYSMNISSGYINDVAHGVYNVWYNPTNGSLYLTSVWHVTAKPFIKHKHYVMKPTLTLMPCYVVHSYPCSLDTMFIRVLYTVQYQHIYAQCVTWYLVNYDLNSKQNKRKEIRLISEMWPC